MRNAGLDEAQVGIKVACNTEDMGLISGLGKSPGEGNGNSILCSCLENPVDRGA